MASRSSVFVDTSDWAMLADRRQPQHAATQTIYQEALRQNRHLVTTNYVLAELVPLLDQRLHVPRPDIFRFIRALQSAPFLDIVYVLPDIDADAWNLLEQYTDKEWSLVDTASLSSCGSAASAKPLPPISTLSRPASSACLELNRVGT